VLDSEREAQIHALGRVLKKAARFAHQTNEPNWDTQSQRRKVRRICVLFKAYSGERTWKAIGDRSQRPNYLSRVDHGRKIQKQEAKDGYQEIFLCEQDHPTLEPVTCRNFRDSPLETKCFENEG